MDFYAFIEVGDEVLDRRDLRRRGRVLSIITDGKLSKNFYVVAWDNGVEELVVLEDLCPLKEIEYQKKMYNVMSEKKSSVNDEYRIENYEASEEDWLNVATSLSKAGFTDDEIVQFIKNGSLVLLVDKFTDELKNVALKLSDNSKIVFKVKQSDLSMPVRKHLDIGEVERYLDEKGREVSKEKFKKKSFSDNIIIRKVYADVYEIDFGDGIPLLIEKEELLKVVRDYNLPKEKILASLEKNGYWKGVLSFYDDLKEITEE